MLWNWDTIDTCFLATSWHVRSKGMFAGCCVGVTLLVVCLEFLRRAGKEYDRYIVARHLKSLRSGDSSNNKAKGEQIADQTQFRPSVAQQAVRALLHMLQFAVAYVVMLLAMYYNGYFILCIFMGAYLGYFVFGWESLHQSQDGNGRTEENATVCCG